jgi:hypothetical protein
MKENRPKTSCLSTKKRPSIDIFNNNFDTHTNYRKTFFNQEKDKGDPFFRTTRVGSCRKVVVKNGIPFALTFKVKNPRGEPLTHYKFTAKEKPRLPTTYQIDYCSEKNECHLGMKKKPLVPYLATHKRNQLPDDVKFRVLRNFSNFTIGNEGLINRKQWISTYNDSYQKTKIYRISNPGIRSDMAKRAHYQLNNIEYKYGKYH